MTKKTSSDSKANCIEALQEFDRLTERIDVTDKLRDSLRAETSEIEQRFDPADIDTAKTLCVRREQLRGVDPYLGRLKTNRNRLFVELGHHAERERQRLELLLRESFARELAGAEQRLVDSFDLRGPELVALATRTPLVSAAKDRLRRVTGPQPLDHVSALLMLRELEAELSGTSPAAAA